MYFVDVEFFQNLFLKIVEDVQKKRYFSNVANMLQWQLKSQIELKNFYHFFKYHFYQKLTVKIFHENTTLFFKSHHSVITKFLYQIFFEFFTFIFLTKKIMLGLFRNFWQVSNQQPEKIIISKNVFFFSYS